MPVMIKIYNTPRRPEPSSPQVVFPDKTVLEFQAELGRIALVEQEEVMKIVTSWMEQGLQQGKQEEALLLILRLLNRRIGAIDSQCKSRFVAYPFLS